MRQKWELTTIHLNDISWKIGKDKKQLLTKTQLEVITEYDCRNKLRGNNQRTRKNKIDFLLLFCRTIKKEFNELTNKEIIRFLAHYDMNTLELYKAYMKQFLRWYHKVKELGYELEELLHNSGLTEVVTRDMLWSENDILNLLDVTDKTPIRERDQCIVMMCYDLALEQSCFHKMNVGSIYFDGDKLMVRIEGKKRGKKITRVNEAIISAPYIKNWLNVHPYKDKKNAPFFLSFATQSYGNRLGPEYATVLLQKLARRAGFEKRITCHIIRHSRGTMLYRAGFRGKPLMRFMGHNNIVTQERYAHLIQEDYDDERFFIDTGLERQQKETEHPLMSLACPKCFKMNLPNIIICNNCGSKLKNEHF